MKAAVIGLEVRTVVPALSVQAESEADLTVATQHTDDISHLRLSWVGPLSG